MSRRTRRDDGRAALDDLGEMATAAAYGDPPQYPIESVDNALKVVLLLTRHASLRMTDVSRYLGVASSSAHRLLAMLQYRGFVAQDPQTRTYVPGPVLDDLAWRALQRTEVRGRAQPILGRLNAVLHETVHLGRLEGTSVHFIAAVESLQALRVASRLGRVMPAHCTSTGKAMLASFTDAEIFELYPDEELSTLTPKSIGTRADLLAKLREIRRRGWAVSREESETGVSSVAVAVPGGGLPRLALNVAVPRSRMTAAAERAIAAELAQAAAELSELEP